MENKYLPKYHVPAEDVIDELKKYMLVDGFDIVLDLLESNGARFVEARTGRRFLDFFTCFASLPVGMNHPKMTDDLYIRYLGEVSLNKPSNSDIYTEVMASFVKTFFKIAVPPQFKYSFFISGGALAVENALKTAFDWKVRQNFRKGSRDEKGHQIIHFRQAFHGRSGYTMSLTNTDPAKTNYYPKFNWPRIENPFLNFPLSEQSLTAAIAAEIRAVDSIKQAFIDNKDDIAAIIIEPIQGEGGDNHFRTEFMQSLRNIADENDALLIFDEIQTGAGITGKWWAHQHYGVTPDIMTFGKKMQICGIIVTDRIDKEPDNVFKTSSRINSTWGGNLVDMARATRYLELIEEESMVENARIQGEYLLSRLEGFANEFPDLVSNPRGKGLFCAFDLPDTAIRNKIRERVYDNGLLILPCGSRSLRFRSALNVTRKLLEEGLDIIHESLKEKN
ncbi:MAG: L-lysine 6-transaminase [Bacteroidota bacterium]|nr:L-lysine 6-transaminase [Bacteroidota bacterium]